MKVNIEFFHKKLADENYKIRQIFATETTMSVIPRVGEILELSEETVKKAGLEISEIPECLQIYAKITGKNPKELHRYLKNCCEVVQVTYIEKRSKPTEIYIRVQVPEMDDDFKGVECLNDDKPLTVEESLAFLSYFEW